MTEQQIIETLATKVMGWERKRDDYVDWWMKGGVFICRVYEWNPIQNIADAWQVLKKLEAAGWEWEMKAANYLYPSIKLTKGISLRTVYARGNDEAEMICNAAMKVVA